MNQSDLHKYMQILQSQMYGLGSSFPWDEKDPEAAKREQEKKAASLRALADKVKQLSQAPAVKIAARVPDYIGTLTGWRGWRIREDKLYALGTDAFWQPRKAERATCKSCTAHAAPAKDCNCGYWTFKTMDLLQTALEPYVSAVTVLGTVECWGKVVECKNGFRSEYAYPKELWLLDSDLEHLSWTYGVAVRKL
jgi:hypothetical protein